MTLEDWSSLPLSNFIYISGLGVSKKLILVFNQKCGREGGDMCGSVVIVLFFSKKNDFVTLFTLF
jgi:hypothetical protein